MAGANASVPAGCLVDGYRPRPGVVCPRAGCHLRGGAAQIVRATCSGRGCCPWCCRGCGAGRRAQLRCGDRRPVHQIPDGVLGSGLDPGLRGLLSAAPGGWAAASSRAGADRADSERRGGHGVGPGRSLPRTRTYFGGPPRWSPRSRTLLRQHWARPSDSFGRRGSRPGPRAR